MDSIATRVAKAAASGNDEAALRELEPLLEVQQRQTEAAVHLIRIVRDGHVPIDRAVDILNTVFASHSPDRRLLGLIGSSLQGARDIDQLNAAPPADSLFLEVVDRLEGLVDRVAGTGSEQVVLDGLATAARMVARQRDDAAERSARRLVEMHPQSSVEHYNLGLFYKTRGRFRDGMLANRQAASLADAPEEAIQWNLGICATGAGEAAVALDVWKRMGQKIEMGRFDLPEGGYPQCKVRLAERPLAERDADNDDPGLEETIWIERLSPCHGIVRSVLYQDLGVDFGDVVLIDGAPITYHTYGDSQVPVFPHLATLVRRNYRFFDFIGTQAEPAQIADASRDLADDSIVYSHTENYEVLCATCWRDPDTDHEHHDAEEKHVVRGRIAAPPHIGPAELLRQLDAAVAARAPCRIFAPALCVAANEKDRAIFEQRRFDMLSGDNV